MGLIRLLMRCLGLSPATPLPLLKVSMPITKTGYTVPVPPTGVLESRDLLDAEPELARRYLLVAAEFKLTTGHDLFLTCTWRSSKRQMELYDKGRDGKPGAVVTMIDGVKVRSRHNFYPSQAVDVCVDVDPGPGKQAVWDPKFYAPLGPLCAKHGLEWGGDFKSFKDYPHMQLPADWTKETK